MTDALRGEAQDVLAFLEAVNDEEGRGIVEPDIVLKMRRVVAAIGGDTRLEERMSALEQEVAIHRNSVGALRQTVYGPGYRQP